MKRLLLVAVLVPLVFRLRVVRDARSAVHRFTHGRPCRGDNHPYLNWVSGELECASCGFTNAH